MSFGFSQRIISFSGYEWVVKNSSESRVGPGNNIFSATTENVFVNSSNQLVLQITRYKSKWYCAEVYTKESFGYGTYIFEIDADLQTLNKNIVFGLFTYDKTMETMFNEIDIEFSKWGVSNNYNTQYVVHNADEQFKRFRFHFSTNNRVSTHVFQWHPDKIVFCAYNVPMSEIEKHEPYMQYVFPEIDTYHLYPAYENVHLNLWKYQRMFSFKKQHQVLVNEFRFIPYE